MTSNRLQTSMGGRLMGALLWSLLSVALYYGISAVVFAFGLGPVAAAANLIDSAFRSPAAAHTSSIEAVIYRAWVFSHIYEPLLVGVLGGLISALAKRKLALLDVVAIAVTFGVVCGGHFDRWDAGVGPTVLVLAWSGLGGLLVDLRGRHESNSPRT